MTNIEWPLGCFLLAPYSVAPRSASVQSDHPVIAASARVYTENNEVLACGLVLNAADEQTLRTFFKTTTAMGTQSFNVEVLRDGELQTVEATFYGMPPSYAPVSGTHVRASFSILIWPNQEDPVYELTATQAVNIPATAFALAGSQPSTPGGTVVTINALASDRIYITKPSIAADPALTWNGWSRYDEDDNNPPGTGLTWEYSFVVSNQDDDLILQVTPVLSLSPATAQAAAAALDPWILTGHTSYTFWYWDSPVADNRGGISLRVETYSLVP